MDSSGFAITTRPTTAEGHLISTTEVGAVTVSLLEFGNLNRTIKQLEKVNRSLHYVNRCPTMLSFVYTAVVRPLLLFLRVFVLAPLKTIGYVSGSGFIQNSA